MTRSIFGAFPQYPGFLSITNIPPRVHSTNRNGPVPTGLPPKVPSSPDSLAVVSLRMVRLSMYSKKETKGFSVVTDTVCESVSLNRLDQAPQLVLATELRVRGSLEGVNNVRRR